MPGWVTELVPVVQLLLNAGALIGGATIWKLYVDNLKAATAVKDATIESVEKDRDFWKHRVEELGKRSPEVMERVLADRIDIRDAEITRLAADTETHQAAISELLREKQTLETDLVRAQGFRLMLALEDATDEEYERKHPAEGHAPLPPEVQPLLFPKPEDVTVELDYLGEVGVDSGQLLVTDPCYIDSEWIADEAFTGYRPAEPSETVEQSDVLGRYSYNGASQASLRGGGQLAYALGHPGAGVAFPTGWGDGTYPVYAEKHNGRTVRVFINVG